MEIKSLYYQLINKLYKVPKELNRIQLLSIRDPFIEIKKSIPNYLLKIKKRKYKKNKRIIYRYKFKTLIRLRKLKNINKMKLVNSKTKFNSIKNRNKETRILQLIGHKTLYIKNKKYIEKVNKSSLFTEKSKDGIKNIIEALSVKFVNRGKIVKNNREFKWGKIIINFKNNKEFIFKDFIKKK